MSVEQYSVGTNKTAKIYKKKKEFPTLVKKQNIKY
jgi:hypothetical protein